jgi:hypothetical protein
MLSSGSRLDSAIVVAETGERIRSVENMAPETKYDFGKGGERMNSGFLKVCCQMETICLRSQGGYGEGS